MEVKKGILNAEAIRLSVLLMVSLFAPAAMAINVDFSPASLSLAVGERATVAVTVTDMPEPGLAALEFEFAFDPGTINLHNPNEAYKSSGIKSFAPLAGNPFCPIVRGGQISDPCPDPEWFLTSTGRSAESGASVVDNLTGRVLMSFGTTSPPSEQPVGDGVVALIEVEGVAGGTGTVTFSNGILADATPTPYQSISFDSLSVNVGGASNQAPVIDPVSLIEVNEGDSVSVTVAAADADGDALSFSSSGLPAFASLTDNGNGTAQLIVAPSFSDAGNYSADIQVTDSAASATTTIEISVLPSNRPPQLDAISDRSDAEGDAVLVSTNATDPDGHTLNFSASGLPDGVSINSATGDIAGVIGFEAAGTLAVTVRVTDSGAPSLFAEQSFIWNIANSNRAPSLNAISDISIAEGDTETVTFSGSDADGDTLAYSATGLPTFASLSGDTLTLSPGFDDAGSYPVTVEVSDGTVSDSQSFTIVVGGTNRAPELAPISDQTVAEGETQTVTFSATDADGDSLTYSATSLPAFASLSGDTLTLSPGFEDAGSYPVTVEVSDGTVSDSQTFTIVVGGTNRAPELAAISDQALAEGETLTVTLSGTDADGDSLTYSATSLPAFASLSGDTLTLAPGFDDAGSYPVTVDVSDGTVSDSQSFTIVVGGTNQAPSITDPGDQNSAEGDSVNLAVSASDADGHTLMYAATGLPTGVNIDSATGVISGTLDYASAGTYPITVTVTDNGSPALSATASFNWAVTETNRAPELSAISDQTVSEGEILTVMLTASDADGDSLTYSATGLPAFASLSGDTLTLSPGFEDAGSYPITVNVSDGTVSDSQTFTIVVGGTNQAPSITDPGDQNSAEGDSVNLAVSASDADGHTLMYAATGLPTGVNIDSTTGVISGTLDYASAGTYSVTVTVTDDGSPALTSNASFAWTVIETNRAPELTAISDQTVAEGETLTVILNGSDADGDSLTYGATGLPTFANLSGDTLTLSPGFEDAGSYPVTVDVSDGTVSDSQSFTVVVDGTNRAPELAAISDQAVAEGETLTVTLSGTDADSDSLTYSATSLPAFASLSGDTLTLAPGFDDAGSYPVTVDVSDGTVSDSQSFTILVGGTNQAPSITDPGDQNSAEGDSVNLAVSASDADGHTLTFAVTGLPAGVNIDSATGVISGTLNYESAGTYPITVTVTDNGSPALSGTASFSWAVTATNRAPELTLISDQTVAEGETQTVTFSATDADGDVLTYSASGLPAFASLSGDTLTLSPGFEDAGSYPVTVDVSDGTVSDSQSFTIVVGGTNRAPELATISDQTVAEGDTETVTFSATDADGDVLTYSATGLPTFANLSGDTLTLSPGFDDAGSYPVTVDVSDGTVSDSQSFTIVVGGTNREPELSAIGDQTVAEGETLTVTLTASDADGDSLTYSATGLPAFASLSGDTLTLSPGFEDAGSYPITVNVSDGTVSDSQTFTILVGGTNQAPSITDPGDQNSAEGDSVNLAVSASDADGHTLMYAATGLPTGVNIDSTTGVISGTLDYASAGTYSVTVTVTDDGSPALTSNASFAWTVIETNRAPELTAISDQTVAEGETLTVILNGSDADGDSLTYSVTGLPVFASLSGDTLTLSPGFEDAGSYPVTVDVSDGTVSDSQTFTIVVGGTNRAPELSAISDIAVAEGDTETVAFSATDADGDSLTYSATSLPAFASLSGDTLTLAPGFDDAGSYPVTAQVSDGTVSDSQTFTIVVGGTNRAPVLNAISDQTVAEGETLIVTLSGTDADGDILTYSASGLPTFASLSGDTLTLSPGFEDAGSYPIMVDVSDGTVSDSQSFTVVVDGTNRAPELAAISDQAVAEGETLTVTLSGTDADSDSLTYSATSLPAFASLSGDTLTLAPGFDDAGSYPVTVDVSDGTVSDSQSFTILVGGTNQAPSITDPGDQNSAEGDSVNLAVSASDADGHTLTFAVTGLPAGVNIDSATGVISGTLNYESAGTYPITVTVTDNGSPALSGTASFNWEVTETNRAPELTVISDLAVAEGETLTVTLTASDADGDSLTYNATGLPTFASLSGDTLTLSPGFDDAGSYPITVDVSDGTVSDSQTFTIVVGGTNRAPELAPISDQTVAEGETLTVTLTASDADGDSLTYSATSLPAFASLSGDTLTLAPDFDDAGSYPVTVDVSDGTVSDSQTFTIVVGGTNRAPELAAISDQTVAEGATLIVTLSGTDADGDSLTYSATSLPAFASLSSDTLTLSPGFDDAGSYPVTVDVSDGTVSDSQTFTIVVGGTNRAPELNAIGDQMVAEGETQTVTFSATDADGDSLTYSASGLPAFANLSGDTLTLSPGFEDAGSYPATVNVSDGTVSDSQSFTIVVGDTNRAPELSSISDQTVAEGETQTVTLNATDADGDSLTYSATGLPAFVSLSGDTLTLSPGFDDAGSYPITVDVSDGTVSDSQSFTIVVGGTNRAPELATISDQMVAEGETQTVTLNATDADGDSLTYSATGLPTFANLSGDTLTLSPGFEDAGSYPVTVDVSDGTVSDSQSFAIVVGGTNRAPVLNAISDQTVAEGDTETVTFSATDADGDTLAYSATGLPMFASLSGDTLTLSPGFDDAGSYPITVNVSDGTVSDSQTFTIVVGGTNQAPSITDPGDQNSAEGDSVNLAVSASDADGHTLMYAATGLPAGVSIDSATGLISGTLDYASAGTYSIIITVTDNGSPALTSSAGFAWTVTETNRAPELSAIGDQTVAEGEVLTFTLTATDADGDSLTYSATGLPTFANLSGDTLTLSPGFDDAGSYSVSVEVSDGTASDSQSFTIVVGGTNQAPALAAISDQTVAEGETQTVTFSATDADDDSLTYSATGLPTFADLVGDTLTLAPGFDDAGSYPVTVDVTDGTVFDSQSFTIVVGGTNRAPVAEVGEDRNVQTGSAVTLDGSSSNDADGDMLSFKWRFVSVPSGSVLTDDNLADRLSSQASFTPDTDGEYTIELAVSDDISTGVASVVLTATTTNVAPNAEAGDDRFAEVFETISLDGSGSDDPDNQPQPLSYQWNLVQAPLGSTQTQTDVMDASNVVATFVPELEGAYAFELTVFDGDSSDIDLVVIDVRQTNVPPMASAGDDQAITLGGDVLLDASESQDPDSYPNSLTYQWQFVSLPTASSLNDNYIVDGTQPVAGFIPDVAGEYILRVRVSDGEATDSDQVVIRVQESAQLPSTPTGLIGRARAYHVNLVWNESDYADDYVVFRRLDGESSYSELGATTSLAFVDDMPAGTRYADYYVVARNPDGVSDPSAMARVLPRLRTR